MNDLLFKTPDELQSTFGERLKRLRLNRNLGQRAIAEKAGISERALRNLESGHGSTVETLLRVSTLNRNVPFPLRYPCYWVTVLLSVTGLPTCIFIQG